MGVTRKITYFELKRRAKAGDLSRDELAAYFLPDGEASTAFLPAVRLNRDLVDTQGVNPAPRYLMKLVLRAQEAAAAKAELPRETTVGNPRTIAPRRALRRISVLAEGDSWFRLPDFFPPGYPDDAIDVLSRTHDVKPVAFWGDKVGDMVNPTNRKNYLVPLNSGLWRHFVFSGGGNDVLGAIDTYVKPFGSAGTNSANEASYVRGSFNTKLDETIGHYVTLYGHVRGSQEPDTPLYVHGYAYAIPLQGGKYLGRKLQGLGFSLTNDLPRRIVREMVNRFNVKLAAFAAARPTVHYVDMRPELGSGDWHTDEIHPNNSGAAKVARRFREAIASTIPTV